MLTSILGARLRWHLADGWVFDPVIVGPDNIEYTLKEGPHLGRHTIQRTPTSGWLPESSNYELIVISLVTQSEPQGVTQWNS